MTSHSLIKFLCTFDVYHISVLHLNINQFVFSCSIESLEYGIHGLWIPVISFDLRSENATCMVVAGP